MSDDCDLQCDDIECGECCLCCCEYGGGGDDCCFGGSSSGHRGNATSHNHRCWFLILLVTLILLTAVAITIAALVVHPVRVAVEDASLAHLALAGPNGTTLAYDVSLVVAMHNRNWAMLAEPGALDAELLFNGESFAHVRLLQESSRGIRPERTELYHGAVAGETTQLRSAGLAEFVKESTAGGVFRLELKLAGDVRYPPHRGVHRLDATCTLELPLSSVTRFTKVKCV